MIAIQPQYLTLSKLFAGRLFTIPEYQRAYSWASAHRQDLFDDILKTHQKGPDEGHFMAAIVCLRRRKQTLGTDDYHVVEIVDGQQRLTTLIILLKAINLALDKKYKTEMKLATELQELLVKVEGDELLLLQTNHDSSLYFANFLRNGASPKPETAKTIADKEILEAIKECRDFVLKWKVEHKSLPLLAALLKNHFYFLLHEIDEERSVYTVFEVLNSRGLIVSWLDRLKSILMGTAFELKHSNRKSLVNDLHFIWREVYSVIGMRLGLSTEALRFAATLYTAEALSRPLSEEDAVEELRKAARSPKSIRQVAHWLLDVTKACHAVASNERLNAVTRIAQARLLATAINLREDIKESDKAKLLSRWEKVTFRIYGMLGNDARKRVGEYVRLAWQVVNDELSVKEIDEAIAEIGKDFPVKEAVDALRKTDCYTDWESDLRYLMFRYEEYLARKHRQNFSNEQWERIWMVSPAESIEHIWPKSKSPERQKHRLGNLVLLPPKLNSKLQDKDPSQKADAYRKTGLLIAGEVANMIARRRWTTGSIEKREKAILKWAAKEWAD